MATRQHACPIWGNDTYNRLAIFQELQGPDALLVCSSRAGGWFCLEGGWARMMRDHLENCPQPGPHPIAHVSHATICQEANLSYWIYKQN